MKFEELDARMRVFETSQDYCVLPGLHIVARLDGRNFTRLTKETHKFSSPYDERFRNYMLDVVEHLMNCGFNIRYGYTQSDEISLLFAFDENTFGRKIRKINSILAGEASAQFSLLLRDRACFDCRVSQLPSHTQIIDYFRWRQEDASRNALNAHCYWCLRRDNKTAKQATAMLSGLSVAEKNELLFQQDINFNSLPNWQKRGAGLYWQEYEQVGKNPLTGEVISTRRRRIHRELDLPMKDRYSEFIGNLLS